MRKLFIKNGWFARKLQSLAEKIDKWWVKSFIIPILTVLPAAAITHHIENASPAPGQAKEGFFNNLHNLAIEHTLLVYVAVTIYLILWGALITWINTYKELDDGVDVKGLLTLFTVFEEIVGFKAKRFGACATDICGSSNKSNSGETFERITQPDQQIALLANGIHTFFDTVDNEDVSFKVTIAEIANNMPVAWYYFCPDSEPPRTTIEDLQDPTSSISCCLSKKNIIIVEDLEKEAARGTDRRYVPRLPDDDEEGSLICYPLIHHYTDDVPYVVTVVADKKQYFRNSKKQLYKWIFKHFALRIGLEHSLLVIKKGCSE